MALGLRTLDADATVISFAALVSMRGNLESLERQIHLLLLICCQPRGFFQSEDLIRGLSVGLLATNTDGSVIVL